MYKKYNLLIIVLLTAVLSVGCREGQTRKEKISNVFNKNQVKEKKDKTKKLLKDILMQTQSLQEKKAVEEAERIVEDFLKVYEERLAKAPKQLAEMDKAVRILKNYRNTIEGCLKVLELIRENHSLRIDNEKNGWNEFSDVIKSILFDVRKDIEHSISKLRKDPSSDPSGQNMANMLWDLRNIDVDKVMEMYDACCELLSEILKGLRGPRD